VNEEQKKEEIKQAVLTLHNAKIVRDTADDAYKEAAKAYMAALDAEGLDSLSTVHKGQRITATKVQSSTLKIDEDGLAEAVGSQKWVTISKRVLDRKLLEDAMMRDRIDSTILTRHSDEVPRAPYVRVNVKAVK
jgi:hypothetical protein